MRKKFITPVIALALATSVTMSSCEEEYNLDDISDDILLETAIAAPIAKSEIALSDLFDLQSMKGTFTIDDDQFETILNTFHYKPKFLTDNHTIDLSVFSDEDFKTLGNLDVEIGELTPEASDFVEVDKMDEFFGEGNPVQEINRFVVALEIENKTDFEFRLGLQFATGDADHYEPIPNAAGVSEDGSGSEVIVAPKTDKKTYKLVFNNMASQLKQAQGIVITYGLNTTKEGILNIKCDDKLSLFLKMYLSATIDLSESK